MKTIVLTEEQIVAITALVEDAAVEASDLQQIEKREFLEEILDKLDNAT